MKGLVIRGFIPSSLVDWDGKISAVIFLGGCNFKCGFCSNKELVLEPEKVEEIKFEKIKNYLEKNKGFVDGVVISGGEPTINSSLIDFCREVKELGFKIKLDTNGSNPEMLKKLLEEKLLDCVAMDIKTRLKSEDYEKVIGSKVNVEDIIKSIKLIRSFGVDHVFRTTVVPGLHDESIIKDIGVFLAQSKVYSIQNLHTENGTLDPAYQNTKPFSKEKLEEFRKIAKPFFNKVVVKE